ncbi:7383_t:CDS:2 [Entrophospora sp. SA101]|nr:10851_t:CDS:2 [Entrophospora sp. SA101]CAJ0764671.1 7383_t:CDS:2 [Entrophospora sp. SA101]
MAGQNRTKVTTACLNCQKRKIKCSGTPPCGYCLKLDKPCVPGNPGKKRGPPPGHEVRRMVSYRPNDSSENNLNVIRPNAIYPGDGELLRTIQGSNPAGIYYNELAPILPLPIDCNSTRWSTFPTRPSSSLWTCLRTNDQANNITASSNYAGTSNHSNGISTAQSISHDNISSNSFPFQPHYGSTYSYPLSSSNSESRSSYQPNYDSTFYQPHHDSTMPHISSSSYDSRSPHNSHTQSYSSSSSSYQQPHSHSQSLYPHYQSSSSTSIPLQQPSPIIPQHPSLSSVPQCSSSIPVEQSSNSTATIERRSINSNTARSTDKGKVEDGEKSQKDYNPEFARILEMKLQEIQKLKKHSFNANDSVTYSDATTTKNDENVNVVDSNNSDSNDVEDSEDNDNNYEDDDSSIDSDNNNNSKTNNGGLNNKRKRLVVKSEDDDMEDEEGEQRIYKKMRPINTLRLKKSILQNKNNSNKNNNNNNNKRWIRRRIIN